MRQGARRLGAARLPGQAPEELLQAAGRDEVQETPNSLAWHQLPKAMTKYRKLNTTQHTAREAKKQRQGQLQAGIVVALGGQTAAAIATGL